jgi:hypothetical protein
LKHSRLRAVALLAIVVVLAAACSKPKEKSTQTGGGQNTNNALSASATPTSSAGPAAGSASTGGAKKNNSPATLNGYLNPGGDLAQQKKIGELIKIQSHTKVDKSWRGVTSDTIHLDFGIDKTNCGVNVAQQAVNAGATTSKADRFYRAAPRDQNTINAQQNEAIGELVQYWNEHITDTAALWPDAANTMKKYNTPGHLIYGRKLTYDLVDAGSSQCPDKQTSAAATMASTTNPFAGVVYDVPGSVQNGVGLANAMKAKMPGNRPMLFGLIDTTDENLHSWAPYVWNEFQSITRMSQLGAEWICQDLKGTGPNAPEWGNGKAVNAVDPALRGKKRVFGLIWPNNPNANQAAADFKTMVKNDCGITYNANTAIQEHDNPAQVASQDASAIATKFKLAGVTTVTYLIDFYGAFFSEPVFRNQGFKPEWATIGTGWQTNSLQRAFIDQDMYDKSSMFYTSFGVQGFGYGPGDAFWVYHATHEVSPHDHKACDPRTDAGMDHDGNYCKAPTAIVGWYYSWLPLIAGMVFAGPDLTPSNVTKGLQDYPVTRYGVDGPTTDPVAVLVGANGGQYYFITDGSAGRWRADFVSPPPERVLGFPDFPDCQRHYMTFDSQLAPQWEKGGPNYNAWCGNPKYTKGWTDQGKAVPYQPSPASGQKCTDAPAKACQTDNYPRWEPVVYH